MRAAAIGARASFAVVLLALSAGGCRCPDAYFAKDVPFEVTVLGVSTTHNTCAAAPSARPPSFAAGDTFTLLGSGDQSSEAGMCDNGTLVAADPPWFATDVLTACGPYGCFGMTASGCAVNALVSAHGSQTGADGSGSGTFRVEWGSGCDAAFVCEESYDVTFTRLGR